MSATSRQPTALIAEDEPLLRDELADFLRKLWPELEFVGSAIDCVLAQRLARRLCAKCKEAYEPTADSKSHGMPPGARIARSSRPTISTPSRRSIRAPSTT